MNRFSQSHIWNLQFTTIKMAYVTYGHKKIYFWASWQVWLVWKFGGIYLDLDYVVMNDMTQYHDFVLDNGSGLITNNAFSFTPGHSFLFKVMEQIQKTYDSECYNCIGPVLFTKCSDEFAKQKQENEELIVEPFERWKQFFWRLHIHTRAGLRASSGRKANRFKTLTFKSVSQNGGKCLKTPVQSTLLAPAGLIWTDWLMTPGTVSMLSSVQDTAPYHISLLNIFKLTTINWRAEYLSILVRL